MKEFENQTSFSFYWFEYTTNIVPAHMYTSNKYTSKTYTRPVLYSVIVINKINNNSVVQILKKRHSELK